MHSTLESSPSDNALLASLPPAVQERLFPKLEPVSLSLGMTIYESGDAMQFVYFPTNSIISLLYVMENGASAEISMVGNDGVAGVSVFMGGGSTTSSAQVRSAGDAYRLSARNLIEEFNGPESSFRVLMLRYTQALITQMAQTAVCNSQHSIDQKLCRWLLLSLDRVQNNELIMTQELIASMLGVRRESVTEAAGKLQRSGTIEYHRGKITVLDRKSLEKMCCECYSVIKMETDRLASLSSLPDSQRRRNGPSPLKTSLSDNPLHTERRNHEERRVIMERRGTHEHQNSDKNDDIT